MSLAYRARFSLAHDPMPRDATGKTCVLDTDDAAAVKRYFDWLAAEPGLGLLTGEAGLGKTTLLRHLCYSLPAPEHKIVYICDAAATRAAVYRNLAAELGLEPKYRRDALWRQLKSKVRKLVEKQSIVPILILDEAQHLGDDFLVDFTGFLNYAFDRQTLLTVWLCGLPSLRERLDLQHHKPLRDRVISPKALRPKSRDELLDMVRHGMKVAGGDPKILAEPALECSTERAEASLAPLRTYYASRSPSRTTAAKTSSTKTPCSPPVTNSNLSGHSEIRAKADAHLMRSPANSLLRNPANNVLHYTDSPRAKLPVWRRRYQRSGQPSWTRSDQPSLDTSSKGGRGPPPM